MPGNGGLWVCSGRGRLWLCSGRRTWVCLVMGTAGMLW